MGVEAWDDAALEAALAERFGHPSFHPRQLACVRAVLAGLQRTSGGHMRLALFQWLTAVDFEAGDGVLVRAPEKPNFSVLESLALTQSFTLKAFMEHRTLTLDEHDRIFRLPHHESFQIFESLGNRHLIGPVRASSEGEPAGSEVVEGLRYQVSPVLAGAIISHLTGRNIVH